MDEDPIQLENDEFGCPRCKVQLIESKSSFYFQKVKAGSFDSLCCEFCGFFVLTEKGFEESTKSIYKLGLTEPIGEDFTAISNTELELFYPVMSNTLSQQLSTENKEIETPVNYTETIPKYPKQTPLLVTSKIKISKI